MTQRSLTDEIAAFKSTVALEVGIEALCTTAMHAVKPAPPDTYVETPRGLGSLPAQPSQTVRVRTR